MPFYYEYDSTAINQKHPWKRVRVRPWHPGDWWKYLKVF